MSDRIKKIKVKQADGNYSEYIPIGADAKDIDFKHNGSNVEKTLKKKPYYYKCVADMKLDDCLKMGDMAVTLGYYKTNDGGGAEYLITDGDISVDNYFVLELQNNLKAVLLYDSTINIKCLGAKSQDKENNRIDVAPFIKAYLNELKNNNNRITLFIPSGVWYTSPILIDNEYGFSIIGEESWQNYGCGGTTISSLNNNQEYIFKIGNGLNYVNNFIIKNITFSSGDYFYYENGNNFRSPDSNVKTIAGACLTLLYAGFGVFDNICFNHIIGKCISITSSWELRFSKLNLTYCSNIKDALIVMEKVDTSINSLANITNIEIQQLNVETVNGSIIKTEEKCEFTDSVINNFHFEPSRCPLENTEHHELNDGNFNESTVVHMALVNMNGSCGLIINNIILNNIAFRYATNNNIQYVYDCIYNITNTKKEMLDTIINNIIISGMKKNLYIALQKYNDYILSKSSKLVLNNINNYSAYNAKIDVKAFGTIHNSALTLNNTRNKDIAFFNNSFNSFYEYVRHSDTTQTRSYIYYDSNALNKSKLVVKPITNSQTQFANLAVKNAKMYIRAKIADGKNYKITFTNPDYTHLMASTLTGTGTYKLYEVDLTNIIDYLKDNPSIAMYSHQDNTEDFDVSLDYFYFE